MELWKSIIILEQSDMLVYKKKRPMKKTDNLKSPKQMERHLKGVANHRRIEILFLIAREKGITVERIAEKLDCNFKTVSEHTRRLVQAGLVKKNYSGRTVAHELLPYGRIFHNFIKTFQHS